MYLTKSTSKYKLPLLFIMSLLMASTSFADQSDPLRIIDLKNRPADEIIPVIKPMLKPNDAVTGIGFQLFVRTDAKTLDEVTRLLQVMDKAPRNLVIKVRNNLVSESKSTDLNTSGNYEVGDDVRVVVGDGHLKEDGAKVRINSNRNNTDRDTEHMIRVIEGGQAFIAGGEIRPYEHRTIIRHRYGVSIYDNVDYREITSGFYVIPRLTDDGKVSLQVQPHYRTVNEKHSGTIDIQESETTFEAKLGEWIQIGGIDTDAKSKNSDMLSNSRNSSNIRSDIYIKVDLE